jgi:hypothetical protein
MTQLRIRSTQDASQAHHDAILKEGQFNLSNYQLRLAGSCLRQGRLAAKSVARFGTPLILVCLAREAFCAGAGAEFAFGSSIFDPSGVRSYI